MPKQSPRDFRNFYIKDVPQKAFCPECHRAIKYVVPGGAITYLVHDIDDVCVMDNQTGSGSDEGVQNG